MEESLRRMRIGDTDISRISVAVSASESTQKPDDVFLVVARALKTGDLIEKFNLRITNQRNECSSRADSISNGFYGKVLQLLENITSNSVKKTSHNFYMGKRIWN